MSITKKDTIILAVLFNSLVFACILVTARQTQQPQTLKDIKERKETRVENQSEEPIALDEIDQLLEEYIPAEDTPKKALKGSGQKGRMYTIQPGDNPWKIARKFHISFEKLLELNGLDEAKARNLKIGQTIRIQEDA